MENIEGMAEFLKAVSHPKRIQILVLLTKQSLNFAELKLQTNLKKTSLSNNLTILIEVKLIERFERGTYRITQDGQELLNIMNGFYANAKIREDQQRNKILKYYSQGWLNRMTETENVLEGIPNLVWGKSGEATYIASLNLAMQHLAKEDNEIQRNFRSSLERRSYEDLMSMSGAAFRINVKQPQWGPSSPDMYPRLHAVEHLGYQLTPRVIDLTNERLKDETFELIKQEIENNRPVIAIDLIKGPDWGIITGYRGDKLVCRTYYDQTSDYSIAQKFPWVIHTINKTGTIQNRKRAIREALKFAYDHFYVEKLPLGSPDVYYANGLSAYDAWIKDLRDENKISSLKKLNIVASNIIELFMKLAKSKQENNIPDEELVFENYWHINTWYYNSLTDARRSAANFLKRVAKKDFEGKEREILQKVEEIFQEIAEILERNWIYFPFIFNVNKKEGKMMIPRIGYIEGTTWTKKMRQKGAEALEKVKIKEIKAYKLLKTTL